jgi:hypothetical protein
MKTKRKTIYRRKFKNSYKTRGGTLITNPAMDLINTHICKKKEGVEKETPGLEIYNSISKSFQLNMDTVGYLQHTYRSSEHKWFKFVVINNDGQLYVYIIDGAKINKHSVAMLQGLLDVTKETGEYRELRDAYNELNFFKNINGSNASLFTEEKNNECTQLISNINELIKRDIDCMPVVSAGSGSVMDNGSICINNKSGHYKPTVESMALASDVFTIATGGVPVTVKEKEDKKLLKSIYGEHAENFSGICL